MIIRKPVPEEIPALYDIGCEAPELRTVLDQPFASLSDFVELVSDGIFLAAISETGPVGFVHALPWKRFGCVQYLVVAPSHRGKGLGRALTKRAISELQEAGASHIYAWARQGSKAIQLADDLDFIRGGDFTYVFCSLRG